MQNLGETLPSGKQQSESKKNEENDDDGREAEDEVEDEDTTEAEEEEEEEEEGKEEKEEKDDDVKIDKEQLKRTKQYKKSFKTFSKRVIAKLPKVERPKSEGTVTEWMSFRDFFGNAVHRNS